MPGISVMVKPVSGRCDMGCRYCFYADEMRGREQALYPRMTTGTLEILVRKVMALADGPVTFAFQGGEPTLAGIDFYRELTRLEKKYNPRGLPVQNAVQTNGYGLSDEMLDFFVREKFLMGVSLDGIRETHDALRRDAAGNPTYDRILGTLDRMKKAGAEFNILCVVNELVARRPTEVWDALSPYGYLQFIPCLDELNGEKRDYSLTPESYEAFLKEIFDRYEKAFRSGKAVSVRNFDNYIGMIAGIPPENCAQRGICAVNLLIEGDGSLFPCDFYAADEWKLGNIREGSLRRMLGSETGKAFTAVSEKIPEKCRDCRWYSLCRNGCRRERENGLNRWCASLTGFFEACYPRMERMAREIARLVPPG